MILLSNMVILGSIFSLTVSSPIFRQTNLILFVRTVCPWILLAQEFATQNMQAHCIPIAGWWHVYKVGPHYKLVGWCIDPVSIEHR